MPPHQSDILGEGILRSQDQARTDSASLAESAYRTVKRQIIRCELEPGGLITEAQLDARCGVGRAAVRAALKRLYQEGLVQSLPRKGYQVAPVTMKGVRDLFGVRVLLEPAAARMAAGRVDGRQLKRLDQLCRAGYRPDDKESVASFLRANTEFHVTVAMASGNDRLAGIIAGLLDEAERMFHLGLMMRDRNEEMYMEHRDLVDALVSGDGESAARVAADQIRSAQRMVIEALLASPSLQSVNLSIV